MTIPASPANSAELERDARLVNASHGTLSPGDIVIGVIIGRTSEFFDFFVYAIASVLVFPAVVFPYVDPVTGTLSPASTTSTPSSTPTCGCRSPTWWAASTRAGT